MDLSKAFDTVDHKIVLFKMDYYEVRESSIDWFSSYLANRKQYVNFNGHKSCLLPITCGVPQGSIFGPVSFLIYINDIVNASSLLHYVLFADDSNLYASHSDLHSLLSIMNEELDSVMNWTVCNKMTLILGKTHYLIFHRNRELTTQLDSLKIGNSSLQRERNTKFLWVNIDEHLKWDGHINCIQNKVNKQCGILYLTHHMLSINTLKYCYY